MRTKPTKLHALITKPEKNQICCLQVDSIENPPTKPGSDDPRGLIAKQKGCQNIGSTDIPFGVWPSKPRIVKFRDSRLTPRRQPSDWRVPRQAKSQEPDLHSCQGQIWHQGSSRAARIREHILMSRNPGLGIFPFYASYVMPFGAKERHQQYQCTRASLTRIHPGDREKSR